MSQRSGTARMPLERRGDCYFNCTQKHESFTVSFPLTRHLHQDKALQGHWIMHDQQQPSSNPAEIDVHVLRGICPDSISQNGAQIYQLIS